MRAFGPGSVSSFLKIILDVVYVALWIGVAILGLITLGAIFLSFNPELLARISVNADMNDVNIRSAADVFPVMTGFILAFGLSTGGVLVIVHFLRQIFMTLTAGDPFHPDNVNRLRLIGAMLAALELGRYAVWGVSRMLPIVSRVEPNLNLTAWFSVLVVFVLAEVFREGARLRREAELTI
jgi:hypothetical protein